MNQNICLCYRPDKGIYVENCHECADTIFIVYDTKGYKTTRIDLPDENFTIWIYSNFRYGSKSYLFAQIEFNGKSLLDFDKNKIRVLNKCSITNFCVVAEDWEKLLYKIASAYNNKTSNACPSTAISYINELIETLDHNSIDIRGYLNNGEPVKWDDKFLVSLLVGDKIVDLLKGLSETETENEILTKRILELCELFLQNLKSIEIDLTDKRTVRFSETINCICKFMNTHGAGLEFLKYFLCE